MNTILKFVSPVVGLLFCIAICYYFAPETTVKVLRSVSGMGGKGDQIVQQVAR